MLSAYLTILAAILALIASGYLIVFQCEYHILRKYTIRISLPGLLFAIGSFICLILGAVLK